MLIALAASVLALTVLALTGTNDAKRSSLLEPMPDAAILSLPRPLPPMSLPRPVPQTSLRPGAVTAPPDEASASATVDGAKAQAGRMGRLKWKAEERLTGHVAETRIVSTTPRNVLEIAMAKVGVPTARIEVKLDGEKPETASNVALFNVSIDADGNIADVQTGSVALAMEAFTAAIVVWLSHGVGGVFYWMSQSYYQDWELRNKLSGYCTLTASLLLYFVDLKYGFKHSTMDQAMIVAALITMWTSTRNRIGVFLWLLAGYGLYRLGSTHIVEPAAALREFYGPMGILLPDMVILAIGTAILVAAGIAGRPRQTTYITSSAPLVQDVRIVGDATVR
jgi:hypothetical protein